MVLAARSESVLQISWVADQTGGKIVRIRDEGFAIHDSRNYIKSPGWSGGAGWILGLDAGEASEGVSQPLLAEAMSSVGPMANQFSFFNLSRLIGYDGVTFDHLAPTNDINPEVLQINIIDIEDDNGVYANIWLLFVSPKFIGKKVLAVPRYC